MSNPIKMDWDVGDIAWAIQGTWPWELVDDGYHAVELSPVVILSIGRNMSLCQEVMVTGGKMHASGGIRHIIPTCHLFQERDDAMAHGLDLRSKGMNVSGYREPVYGFEEADGHLQVKDSIDPLESVHSYTSREQIKGADKTAITLY